MSNVINSSDVLSPNNELDTIKININVFLSLLHKLENDYDSIPSELIKKSEDLQKTYNCFASNYDARSLWEKKKFIASKVRKDTKYSKPKLHIITSDFSDETKCKKEFMGYLNKLTDVNKNIIYNKISAFISNLDKSMYHLLSDIIWNFIKISSNNIYIDILYLFNKDYTDKIIKDTWKKYIDNKEWLPSSYILSNNILENNENKYDEYCDYVKWKKGSISLARAWCYIMQKNNSLSDLDILLDNLVENLMTYVNNTTSHVYKHVIDILLDQINTILDIYKSKRIINIIKDIDISNFENSSKFKIYNILEK
jgi:hypothetical protein